MGELIDDVILWLNVFNLVRLMKECIYADGIPLEDFAFNIRLGRELSAYETNPQHVQVGKMLVEKGVEIRKGDTIKYVLTKKGARPLILAKVDNIDRDKYAELFESAIAQILEPFGLDFDEMTIGLKQTKLQPYKEETT